MNFARKIRVPTFWRSLSARRRKLVGWTAALLAFYTVFGFLVLPLIVRAVATKRLARELNRQVTIESVRINPYALSCAIRGLNIRDPDGETFVSWDKVYVNLQLASFFGKPWVLKEFSTTNTYVRAQMNKDYSLNFSDLLEKFGRAGPEPKKPSKPLGLRIGQLSIRGARASITDMTPREPFRRMLGPVEIMLNNFHTDPESKNPHSFTGSTDSGEVFSWSGYFFLNPIRAAGELSVANVALNKYAPLYQDLVRFEIQDGIASLRGAYQFERTPTTNLMLVTNISAALRSFKLAEPGASNSLVELPGLAVSGLSGDLLTRRVDVGSLAITGAVLNLKRAKDASINVVEVAKPATTATNAPGGILVLLRAVTNVFSALLASTNTAVASLQNLSVENCSASLEDDFQSRPVKLVIDQLNADAKNLSNLPGSNLTANISLRWNTNGTIKTDVNASLLPLAADVGLQVAGLEFHPLDPYLEPYVNVFILGSKLGLDGQIQMRAQPNELPVVTFSGSSSLDDFSTVDGVMAEELIKWRSLQLADIKANLNPPEVSIGTVELHDLFARLAVETNRNINILAALRPANTNQAAPVSVPKPALAKATKPALAQVKEMMSRTNAVGLTNMPKLNIATIAISNGWLQLGDRSLLPHVQASVQKINGTITDVSTEELRRAQVHVSAKVDNTGPVEITGKFSPLHLQSASELKVVFHDVDLNPTDPYSGKFLGYRLRKGKLSMEVDYQVSAKQLKGRNHIELDQLTLGEKVDSPDATKLPVKLGLALLKDRSGKIELDVPVEGNLEDPKFRIGGVIWSAVANVFTKIITSPFAALGSLFGGKGEEVRYQEFEPGVSDLQNAAREKLDALSKALYERPGLEVEIEGHTDPAADREALRHRKLEHQLCVAKWTRLRKSEQSITSPEQIVVSPEERQRFLTELYRKSVTQTAGPANGSQSALKESIIKTSVGTEAKGASILMQQPKPDERQQLLTALEQELLNSISVEDSDLRALASERARQVQLYLIESGKVEAERVYLTRSGEQAASNKGSRVYLQLH